MGAFVSPSLGCSGRAAPRGPPHTCRQHLPETVLAMARQAAAHRSTILGRYGCAPGTTSFIEQPGDTRLVAQQGKVTLLISASCSSHDGPHLVPTLPHASGDVGTCCQKASWVAWAISAVSCVSSHGSWWNWRGRALQVCDGGHRGLLVGTQLG